MRDLLLVATGGALGSIMRLKLGGFILHHSINLKFPLSTFAVNMLGCLLIGAFAGILSRFEGLDSAWKTLVMTGILGGFTTFSAFGFEITYLIGDGLNAIAALYALSSVVGGVLAVFTGLWITKNLLALF